MLGGSRHLSALLRKQSSCPSSALCVLGVDNDLVALLESLLPQAMGSFSSYLAFEVSSLCSLPLLSLTFWTERKID